MSYQERFNDLSLKLESICCFRFKDRYEVWLYNVCYKDGYAILKLSGSGTTIEDACYNFILKAKNRKLVNIITNKEIIVI